MIFVDKVLSAKLFLSSFFSGYINTLFDVIFTKHTSQLLRWYRNTAFKKVSSISSQTSSSSASIKTGRKSFLLSESFLAFKILSTTGLSAFFSLCNSPLFYRLEGNAVFFSIFFGIATCISFNQKFSPTSSKSSHFYIFYIVRNSYSFQCNTIHKCKVVNAC